MCFSVKATKKASNLAEKYGVRPDGFSDAIRTVEEQLNAFTHPELAVVSHGSLSPMRWGLIPHWARDHASALEIRNKTLNARSETAFERPSFRDPIRHHRCIIPVDAFFEWQHVGKDKVKYLIESASDEVLSIAGIWDSWVSPQQSIEIRTFSILTCPANPTMAEIHNTQHRMPVILDMLHVGEWLAFDTPEDRIKQFMSPCPDGWLHAVRESA